MSFAIFWFIVRNVTCVNHENNRWYVHVRSNNASERPYATLQRDANSTFSWRSLDIICIPCDSNCNTRETSRTRKESPDVACTRSLSSFQYDETDYSKHKIERINVSPAHKFV